MTRWFTYAAALAAWLAVPLLASAQTGYPQPVGAARIPEPLGYTPKQPLPDLRPGPVTPDVAPMGPGPDLSLPANIVSAFQCETYPTEEAFFASIGGMSFQRYRLQERQYVFREFVTDPNNPIDQSPAQFYPLLPASARPALQDLKNLHPSWEGGVRATAGYLFGNQAVELTGWYVSPTTKSLTTQQGGLLTVPFGTISPSIPLGFEGNNGLWVNADKVVASFSSQVGNVEFNYRTWNTGIDDTELIVGVRCVSAQEKVAIFTDDEFLTRNAVGATDPTRAATYTSTTRNNIVAVQMGGEYSAPVPIPLLCQFLWFTTQGKVGYGPNFIDRRFKLVRGDGFKGLDVSRTDVNFGQIYDLTASFDFHILERMRIRVGYQALWLVGTSNAGTQINFDLTTQGRQRIDYNSQFYHGPIAEFQFLF
jgi:hypothetical protein